MDPLGEQVGDERRQQRDRGVGQRVLDPPTQRTDSRGDREADDQPTARCRWSRSWGSSARTPWLLLIALVVVGGTLLIQGSSLPLAVRRLGLSGPDAREDALSEAATYQRAATAGLQRLEEIRSADDPEDVVEELQHRSLDRAKAVWEQLRPGAETPSQAYARL
ncbi:MAG: hypothetical protein ACRDOJ_04180, partial [Nocardioidaceae bacterium]